MEYVKLRYGLEAHYVQHQGKPYLLLRDRLGYSEKTVLFAPAVGRVLALLDGSRTLRDVQAEIFRETGELLFSEQLEEIVRVLDENLFLENQRYIQHVAQTVAQFRQDPVRRAHHAGKSYPEEPGDLKRLLEGFFSGIESSKTHRSQAGSEMPGRLCALVAPHIDIRAGGPTFAHAYRCLRQSEPPAAWVVLGTGHEPVDNWFAVTLKDFETPLGVVACDKQLGQRLIQSAPMDVLAGEYNHRLEHTIEFQAVFLAHTQPTARIVPVLCSFGLEEWKDKRSAIDDFCDALRVVIRQSDYPVGLIASVDLAHVGPRYGDSITPSEGTIRQHMARDRALLDALSRCDAHAFMDEIVGENNARKVCGVAPLYVLSRVLAGRATGRILDHAHAVVDPQGSFVTYAAMAFFEEYA
ncbi:hypothetical protein SAMN02746041_00803 [Desulfacinum hydrothermale DSM 13146]|uniref:AmmeMemoRadiSam system protein B n=1 Tax=Desulfacinum hydrothermale DSM 13146 TaxID=1121390 RepID=A0A1W1X836_9BACT|nr:AmmeMemoRadiSam system protein B [Desulfacinum hydrothermale]SMC20086.1 hypothetical protein SAMN02746041_00803 [Desulfacinum hydrothermale DSM 13146]